jgi:hypothetical protein
MELAVDKEKLEAKINFYRVGWFLFSVLVLGPAWFVASSVEGVSFGTAVDVVSQELHVLYFPNFLISLVVYPVTLLATFIPGSSAVIFLVFMSVFSYGALAITFVFFGLVQPPNYNAMKSKLDPNWEAKENEGVLVKPAIRAVTFSGFIIILLLTTLLGEIIYGYNRDPMADDYVGQVYIIDIKGKKTPLKVTLKLAMIDPGRIYDRKPGVSDRSLHIQFDGEHLKGLSLLGIDEKLFASYAKNLSYSNSVCSATRGTTRKGVFSRYTGKVILRSYDFQIKHRDWDVIRCPESVHFAMSSFDEAEFAITNLTGGYVIAADLERKSRISFIQRMIMKHRYNKNQNTFYDRD